MKLIIRKNWSELIVSILFAFISSFPITGFLHGFIANSGSGELISDIKGRLFIGIFEAIASATSWGRPFGDNAEAETLKFRFLIFFVFLILTFLVFRILTYKKQRVNEE